MIRLISFLVALILSVNSVFGQEITQKREINKGNLISGICLFLTPELICAFVTTEDHNPAALYLPIPIVGPFITNSIETPGSSEGIIVAIGISTAEAIGITLITLGIIGKKKINKQAMIYPIINKNEYGIKLKVDL
jgi:hypothetical protein